MTIVLICTFILLIALIICCISLCNAIEKYTSSIIDRLLTQHESLYNEIQINWQAIQSVKSDISYLPKREELGIGEETSDVNSLNRIAKSFESIDKYFTHNGK